MSDKGSLKDVFNDFGDTEVKATIADRYNDLLMNSIILGEETEFKEVNTAIRKFDHGQASSQTVSQSGVKSVFDPEKVELNSLKEGGSIRRDLRAIAEQHFPDSGDIIIDVHVGERPRAMETIIEEKQEAGDSGGDPDGVQTKEPVYSVWLIPSDESALK